MIQITQFPIKKSIYYEIITVLMAIYGGFQDTFSADHKFGLVVEMQVPTHWRHCSRCHPYNPVPGLKINKNCIFVQCLCHYIRMQTTLKNSTSISRAPPPPSGKPKFFTAFPSLDLTNFCQSPYFNSLKRFRAICILAPIHVADVVAIVVVLYWKVNVCKMLHPPLIRLTFTTAWWWSLGTHTHIYMVDGV